MLIRSWFNVICLSAALSSGAMLTAHAASLSEIKAAKKVRIAVAMGVPQFAFVDANLQPTGSDVETAKMIAKDLGVELELVEVTNAARVPTLQTHKADILVADLAITDERKKAVDFTVPYATLTIIVAGSDKVAIKDYPDLEGKRIGVTRATVNDTLVTKNTKSADIVRFEDDATLMTAAVTGQVDIVSTQDVIISEINKKRPDKLNLKFVQKELLLGIATPKGETDLQAWLNDWIKTRFNDGSLNATFKKFHNRDLPSDLVAR